MSRTGSPRGTISLVWDCYSLEGRDGCAFGVTTTASYAVCTGTATSLIRVVRDPGLISDASGRIAYGGRPHWFGIATPLEVETCVLFRESLPPDALDVRVAYVVRSHWFCFATSWDAEPVLGEYVIRYIFFGIAEKGTCFEGKIMERPCRLVDLLYPRILFRLRTQSLFHVPSYSHRNIANLYLQVSSPRIEVTKTKNEQKFKSLLAAFYNLSGRGHMPCLFTHKMLQINGLKFNFNNS